jgi:hypothetical protein
MIKRLFVTVALLCAMAGSLCGQNTTTFGNITALGVPCGAANCVYYQLPQGTPWVLVTVSGTWTGVLETATTSAPNANYSNLDTVAWTALATETANGTWSPATSGATYLRVRATAWTSGTAQVNMAASEVLTPMMNPIFPGSAGAGGTQIGSAGVTFPDGSVQASAAAPAIAGLSGDGTGNVTVQKQLSASTVAAGSVVPTTPIALANGGTGASTAAAALTALGADPFGAAPWNVVLSSGADNTGATVTNTQLQAALNASHNVYIPDGTYLVNAVSNRNGDIGGLAPRSNTTITCSRNAILQVQTNSSTDYVIFRLAGYSATFPAATVSNNVTIQGCNLVGDVTTHTGTTGEWGFGVAIWGASGITLRDDTISNMWGDGILLNGNPVEGNFYPIPANIILDNVRSLNNRRQGMSLVNVNGIKTSNSTFAGTGSIKLTAPGAGVDIEPCCGVESDTNISFQNVDFTSNAGNGLIANAGLVTDPANNISIAGGSATGNGDAGFNLYNIGVSRVRIHDTLTQNNAGPGINTLQTGDGIEIDHNSVIGNNTVSTDPNFDGKSNITVQGSLSTRVNNNIVRVGTNSNLPQYGIQLLVETAAQVFGNDLVGSGSLGDFNDFTGTNNAYCFNQITAGQQTCQGIAINFTGLQTKLLTGNTGSIGGSALAAGQCVSGSATVTGVAYGEVAAAQPQAWLNGAFSIYATTNTNVVNVYVCAIVAGTPTATPYSVRVIQ